MLVFPLIALAASCGIFHPPTPTPLPGWRSPVSELFVDESAFPEGWQIGFPEATVMDPTVNHVRREWWGPPNEPSVVIQDIWRAYTVGDAEKGFAEEVGRCFAHGGITRFPITSYRFPPEVTYRSKVADKWCLTCGVDGGGSDCNFVARYRNYIVRLYIPLKEKGGSDGLTFTELDTLLNGVDAQFVQYLGFPVSAPVEPMAAPDLPICSKSQPSVDSLLVGASSLPSEWEVAFPEWEWPDANVFVSGCLITRNFRRGNCYSNGDFEWCYATQLVSWYQKESDARDEWMRMRPWLEEPSEHFRWEIPSDIVYHSPIADDQLIACAVSASGERCEAAMRYGNYLIILRAEMMFTNIMAGYTCRGLTHAEFATLVEAIDTKVELELDGAWTLNLRGC